MCYGERFLTSWATRKAQKRQEDQPVSGRVEPPSMPIRTVVTPVVERRKEVERGLEEIV
jgi:hypothetical protein